MSEKLCLVIRWCGGAGRSPLLLLLDVQAVAGQGGGASLRGPRCRVRKLDTHASKSWNAQNEANRPIANGG